jgi:hypothetical protein
MASSCGFGGVSETVELDFARSRVSHVAYVSESEKLHENFAQNLPLRLWLELVK